MDIFLDSVQPRTVTRQLYEQIRTSIAEGRLRTGDRLPTSRALAAELGIARQTVTTVYGRLKAEGYTAGRPGGGTFVNATPAPARRREPPTAQAAAPETIRHHLTAGTPDPSLFPVAAWRRAVRSAAEQPPPGYGDAAGLPGLREVLARHASRHRGVVAGREQVVVTSGAQQAFDLTLRLLTRPGDRVAVEDPGYRPVHDLIVALGRQPVPVPVDRHGLRADLIPPDIAAIHVTPSHQSPMGATLSLTRRAQLLALAEREDFVIIEDDYDSEHRYVDRPLEPLQRLDGSGRVVYVATFSKTLSPSLRLGYAIAPPALVEPLVSLRTLADGQPPDLTQRAMLQFILDGELDRHLSRTRRVYQQRNQLVTEFLDEQAAAGHVRPFAGTRAGLHVAAQLLGDRTDAGVRAAAARRGVRLGNHGECWSGTPRYEGLIIGFGATPADQLGRALDIVAGVLAGP